MRAEPMMERFGRTASMREIDPVCALHVRALRIAVVARTAGLCLRRNLARHLRDERQAARFLVFLQAVGAAWPEPVVVQRPCCGLLSHDERTIAALLARRAKGDRPSFDRLLEEMIPADERRLLWNTAGALFDLSG